MRVREGKQEGAEEVHSGFDIESEGRFEWIQATV
jgi:hypothetical protein